MSTEEFLSLAIELISAGKKENARTAIRQVLDSDPDNVNAWALLVQVAKSPDEEMNAIREVLRLKPDDSWAQRYLADLVDKEALNRIIDLIKLERKEQAVFLLDQVLSRSPNNPDAWALKARLAGKREDAIIALEEVLRLRPDDDRARQYLTRLINEQQEIERKRIEKAQKEEEEKLRQSMGAPVETTEKKKRRLSSDIIYGLMGVILLLTLICFVFGYPLLPEDQRVLGDLWLASEGTPTEEGAKIIEGSCEALINKALEVSDTGCQRIGRNEICYGNYDITIRSCGGRHPYLWGQTDLRVAIGHGEEFVGCGSVEAPGKSSRYGARPKCDLHGLRRHLCR
jgi:tetratricopeptide (TPR) repeat protein